MSEAPLPSKLNVTSILAEVCLEISRLETEIETLKTHLQNSNGHILLLRQYVKMQHQQTQEHIKVFEARNQGLRQNASYADHLTGVVPKLDGH